MPNSDNTDDLPEFHQITTYPTKPVWKKINNSTKYMANDISDIILYPGSVTDLRDSTGIDFYEVQTELIRIEKPSQYPDRMETDFRAFLAEMGYAGVSHYSIISHTSGTTYTQTMHYGQGIPIKIRDQGYREPID